MGDYLQAIFHKLQFVVAGALIIGICTLISLTVSTLQKNSQANSTTGDRITLNTSSNANAVTSAFVEMSNTIQDTTAATGEAFQDSLAAIGSGLAKGGTSAARGIWSAIRFVGRVIVVTCRFVVQIIVAVIRGIGAVLWLICRGVASVVIFVLNIPGDIAEYVSHSSVVSSFVQPSHSEEVPVIDPDSPELKAAIAALPPEQAAPAIGGPVWPMSGAVTTEFGVPHRPYQHTHTGIDISDGKRAGVTPIRPFRPGHVVEVIHSRKGLGNHVIVDHGNGVTSVYAHLDSTAVQIGQEVNLSTTIGQEGTTGVSTGPHLHFEIRVNGQATNPRNFIPGQP